MASSTDLQRVARSGYWRESDARVAVDAWRASGESMVQFAQRHGIGGQRLARWSARLGGQEQGGMRFHPVRLRTSAPDSGGGGHIEIDVGGRRIRVGPGFDAEDLRRVLSVLEESAGC